MFRGAKEVELLLLLIPVPSNPLEASGAIIEGMGQNANLGFGERHELLTEEGVRKHFELLSD
jgi:hypothetical protein